MHHLLFRLFLCSHFCCLAPLTLLTYRHKINKKCWGTEITSITVGIWKSTIKFSRLIYVIFLYFHKLFIDLFLHICLSVCLSHFFHPSYSCFLTFVMHYGACKLCSCKIVNVFQTSSKTLIQYSIWKLNHDTRLPQWTNFNTSVKPQRWIKFKLLYICTGCKPTKQNYLTVNKHLACLLRWKPVHKIRFSSRGLDKNVKLCWIEVIQTKDFLSFMCSFAWLDASLLQILTFRWVKLWPVCRCKLTEQQQTIGNNEFLSLFSVFLCYYCHLWISPRVKNHQQECVLLLLIVVFLTFELLFNIQCYRLTHTIKSLTVTRHEFIKSGSDMLQSVLSLSLAT